MERKNYRIIALDMDGTLLTSDKTIAPDTVRDIRAASERGIHVVYCTGRAVPELKLYFDMDRAHVFDIETEENVLYRKGC